MTTSVILPDLVAFTQRVCRKLGIPCEKHAIGKLMDYLPTNPHGGSDAPLLFVPSDVLRPLPVATDRTEICEAASRNQDLRDCVNAHIGAIWNARTKRGKARLRQQILADARAMKTLLDAYHSVDSQPYDTAADSEGRLRWATDAKAIANRNPISLQLSSEGDASSVVFQIIAQFKFLIEHRGLWRNLYFRDAPLHEHYSQSLFFAIAHSYCKANNLDISPEVDTGSGRIDFKFSSGFRTRVNVEIKLSTNPKVVEGYAKQIDRYNVVEETREGFYVVIDVGLMREKDRKLIEAKNDAVKRKAKVTEIVFIDALPKRSASKT